MGGNIWSRGVSGGSVGSRLEGSEDAGDALTAGGGESGQQSGDVGTLALAGREDAVGAVHAGDAAEEVGNGVGRWGEHSGTQRGIREVGEGARECGGKRGAVLGVEVSAEVRGGHGQPAKLRGGDTALSRRNARA